MANIFDSVKVARTKSSNFDLSHDVKLSFNMGYLTPVLCMETLPGDKFRINSELMLRFQPMVAPIMHQIYATMHYYFVPNRILWPNWENFITNTKVNDVLPAMPTLGIVNTAGDPYFKPLADYLGIPNSPDNTRAEKVSALPFAAYQKIYDEYYRDQNLIPSTWKPLVDGDNVGDIVNLVKLRKRAWEHDYFTAALPFAQKGDAVSIPLGKMEDVDVYLRGDKGLSTSTYTGTPDNMDIDSQIPSDPSILAADNDLFARTSDAIGSSTTINDLRQATRLQAWLEKMARGGSRMIEVIKMQFGVKSSDARLNRPEYITGTKSPVVISEVLNTTGTADAPQGQMAGHGISVSNGKNGSYYCEEHGFIIGIMSVLPKPAYMQGVPKFFLKDDPMQFAWPDFAHLGEQPVENRELYAYTATGEETFGYVPRYAEYKYQPSRVAGDFRTTLDFWHGTRKFATQPLLNQQFIEMDPSAVDRIFAVTDPNEQKMLAHVFHDLQATRKLPKFGTPTF